MAGLWKSIKKLRRGSRAARKLCEHLQDLGIDARMIKENCLALAGQSIDMVKVSYYGGSEFDPISRYDVDYGVRGNVKDVEDQVRVHVMIKTKGILSDKLKWVGGRRTVGKSEIVDLRREGGELAEELNRDVELKMNLLQQIKEASALTARKFAAGAVMFLPEVFPDKKAGMVWIRMSYLMSPLLGSLSSWFGELNDLMPSETSFRSYNTIANLIRKRVSKDSLNWIHTNSPKKTDLKRVFQITLQQN